jgi:hypothetical protein
MLNNSLAPYLTNNIYPTPTALNRPRSPETMDKCAAYRKAKAGQTTVPLYLEEVALSSALQAPPTSTPGGTSPNAHLACYLRYRSTTCSALRSERRWLLLKAIRRRDPAKPGEIRRLRRGWTREALMAFVRPSFRRSLNPAFVAWLMSWPPGSTSFDSSETASRIHAAHWRSELSRLSFPAAPPAQLSLWSA